MDRSDYLYDSFISHLKYIPTESQQRLFKDISQFIVGDDDIMVINGYAGTGKTTAISSVVEAMSELKSPVCLLAPTGRAAKTLGLYAKREAKTIHKEIYRQVDVGEDEGFEYFNLNPKSNKNTLFIVDEVSLINIDNSQNSPVQFGTGNLLVDLIKYVRRGVDNKLILMGDGAQLPPIGMTKSPALSQEYMYFAGNVKFTLLSDVVRQKQESGILKNATIIRNYITQEDFTSISNTKLGLQVKGYSDIERVNGSELIDLLSDAYSRYGEDETIVLCRSNKRANRYNAGIRSMIHYKEDRLVKGDNLMIVKNCYQFLENIKNIDYIANGDIAKLKKVHNYQDRYGFQFADAVLVFPDYDMQEVKAKICLDTLESESASLTFEEQNALYQGVKKDYSHLKTKKQRYKAIKEDPYYNALQIKYADAITCHKSQGGQWKCVFIDNAFWQDELSLDDLKWLYTAITRAVEKVYFINFKDNYFLDI